jgi:transposase
MSTPQDTPDARATEAREQRGLEIAATKKLRQKGDLWLVPSSTGAGTYVVDPTVYGPATCTCPDYELRQTPCKHVYAVEYTIRRETSTKDGTVTETITYRQEWSAYNAAQANEKVRVAQLLRDLCSVIDNPVQGRGRPRLPLADQLFCAVMKVYGGMSARRTSSDLRDFAERGLIDKAPHYNSVINALENPDLTPFLRALIEESAAPLAAVESDFAADSSGFSTNVYARWFSAKYGKEMAYNFWVKAHVMVGTRTNIITAVEVTDNRTSDSPILPTLLESSAKRFEMKRVSADKGYLADSNVKAIVAHGAQPFIAPKVNTAFVRPNDASRKKSELWDKMLHYYLYRKGEFLHHYHKRSNVETTFHMIKAKFGSRIRSKSATAMVNEVLCKALCHNLCVLVQSMYELGIEAKFWNKNDAATSR